MLNCQYGAVEKRSSSFDLIWVAAQYLGLCLFILAAIPVNANSRELGNAWSSWPFPQSGQGPDGGVMCIEKYSNGITIGGVFEEIDSQVAGRIAQWNGYQWDCLEGGVGGGAVAVQDLLAVGDSLYVVGDFESAGGIPASGAAVWDGSAWASLGQFNAGPSCLTVYNQMVIVAGGFSVIDGGYYPNVAGWDGQQWHAFGSSGFLSGHVIACVVFEGELYVGGTFRYSGFTELNYIARWDGESWTPVGRGFDEAVLHLNVLGGQLVAGGNFTISGEQEVGHIAVWNGSTWGEYGSGIFEYGAGISVVASCQAGQGVVVGGQFHQAGDEPVSNICMWDGVTWDSMSGGANNLIYAIEAVDSGLVVGGRFTEVGGVAVDRLAFWRQELTPIDSHASEAMAVVAQIISATPNPFNPSIRIDYATHISTVVHVHVVDISGRLVASIKSAYEPPGRHSVHWDGMTDAGREAASGVYFVALLADGARDTKKIVLLK